MQWLCSCVILLFILASVFGQRSSDIVYLTGYVQPNQGLRPRASTIGSAIPLTVKDREPRDRYVVYDRVRHRDFENGYRDEFDGGRDYEHDSRRLPPRIKEERHQDNRGYVVYNRLRNKEEERPYRPTDFDDDNLDYIIRYPEPEYRRYEFPSRRYNANRNGRYYSTQLRLAKSYDYNKYNPSRDMDDYIRFRRSLPEDTTEKVEATIQEKVREFNKYRPSPRDTDDFIRLRKRRDVEPSDQPKISMVKSNRIQEIKEYYYYSPNGDKKEQENITSDTKTVLDAPEEAMYTPIGTIPMLPTKPTNFYTSPKAKNDNINEDLHTSEPFKKRRGYKNNRKARQLKHRRNIFAVNLHSDFLYQKPTFEVKSIKENGGIEVRPKTTRYFERDDFLHRNPTFDNKNDAQLKASEHDDFLYRKSFHDNKYSGNTKPTKPTEVYGGDVNIEQSDFLYQKASLKEETPERYIQDDNLNLNVNNKEITIVSTESTSPVNIHNNKQNNDSVLNTSEHNYDDAANIDENMRENDDEKHTEVIVTNKNTMVQSNDNGINDNVEVLVEENNNDDNDTVTVTVTKNVDENIATDDTSIVQSSSNVLEPKIVDDTTQENDNGGDNDKLLMETNQENDYFDDTNKPPPTQSIFDIENDDDMDKIINDEASPTPSVYDVVNDKIIKYDENNRKINDKPIINSQTNFDNNGNTDRTMNDNLSTTQTNVNMGNDKTDIAMNTKLAQTQAQIEENDTNTSQIDKETSLNIDDNISSESQLNDNEMLPNDMLQNIINMELQNLPTTSKDGVDINMISTINSMTLIDTNDMPDSLAIANKNNIESIQNDNVKPLETLLDNNNDDLNTTKANNTNRILDDSNSNDADELKPNENDFNKSQSDELVFENAKTEAPQQSLITQSTNFNHNGVLESSNLDYPNRRARNFIPHNEPALLDSEEQEILLHSAFDYPRMHDDVSVQVETYHRPIYSVFPLEEQLIYNNEVNNQFGFGQNEIFPLSIPPTSPTVPTRRPVRKVLRRRRKLREIINDNH